MVRRGKQVGFELSISARDDGTLEALYILLQDAKVARTEEIIEDIILADYDEDDCLIGIEVLAPVKLSQIAKLVEQPRRKPLRKFLIEQAPEYLVLV